MKVEWKHSPLHDDEATIILKAAAQTWYAYTNSGKFSNDHKSHRRQVGGPSRFKLEAETKSGAAKTSWDFNHSLLDSYERLAVYKTLENGLYKDDELLEGEVDDHIRLGVERTDTLKDLNHTFSCIFGTPLDLERTYSWRLIEDDMFRW